MKPAAALSTRTRRAAAALGAAACTAASLTVPATAAWEGDYGARAVVTPDSTPGQVEVTVDLPAPASGGAVTWASAAWDEVVPQSSSGLTTSKQQPFDVSGCTDGVPCRVTAILPTVRMENGTSSIAFRVSNAAGLVSFFYRQITVANPKPTVELTSPAAQTAVWGDATFTADAAPSTDPDSAELKGVRFYLDGTLGENSPYEFDATSPYAVTVPATDIGPVLSSRYVVVVAEDTAGNLSVMPPSGSTGGVRRLVSVGPAPVVSVAPTWAGGTSGSVDSGVDVDVSAALPETAPSLPGQPVDPYLDSVTLLLDGTEMWTTDVSEASAWNDYDHGKHRAIGRTVGLTAAQGLTAGQHTIAVRVATSYDAVATASTTVRIANGVTWGRFAVDGRAAGDGYVVTAGTTHDLALPVSAAVAGTGLLWTGVRVSGTPTMPDRVLCYDDDPCPGSTTIRVRDWLAPVRPGLVTVTGHVQVAHEAGLRTVTRTLLVQPAAHLSARLARLGTSNKFRLTGRLTQLDTRQRLTDRTVEVQCKRPGTTGWRTLTTRRTDGTGSIAVTVRPVRSTAYRLFTPERHGTMGAGISPMHVVRIR